MNTLPLGRFRWSHSKYAVLVAGDHSPELKTVLSALEEAEFEVLSASDAKVAIAILRQASFPVSLLLADGDHGTPQSGVLLAAEAKQIAPELAILLISDGENLKVDGMDCEFIRRPIETRKLIETIRRMIIEAEGSDGLPSKKKL